VVIDNLFFARAIAPSQGGEFKSQLRSALERMDATLSSAGLSRSAVAQVSVYFPTVELKPMLNEVWSEWFPDPADRPPHKYVPDALPDNQQVQLQVFALRDATRQVLEIPGLVHGDPMSMGVRIADQVFSSRLFGTDTSTGATPDDPERQAQIVFGHARTLLAQAGGTPRDTSHINAFITSDQDRAAAQKAFDALFADTSGSARPSLRFLSANLPGRSTVRIEVLGSVSSSC
jgi:enamine deaminase RidA (YjgF/YER057c/UK114 family)